MGSVGEAFFELGARLGQLLQSSKGIAKHAAEIESRGRPIECPEGFNKVGVEFKQLTDEPLRNLGGG